MRRLIGWHVLVLHQGLSGENLPCFSATVVVCSCACQIILQLSWLHYATCLGLHELSVRMYSCLGLTYTRMSLMPLQLLAGQNPLTLVAVASTNDFVRSDCIHMALANSLQASVLLTSKYSTP